MIYRKVFTGLAVAVLLTGCNTDTSAPAEGNPAAPAEPDVEQTESENLTDQQESTDDAAEDAETGSDEVQSEEAAGSQNIKEFDLELEFFNGDEWDYDYEKGDLDDTEIERSGQSTIKGQEAADEIETLLAQVEINTSRQLSEVKEDLLNAIGVAVEEIEDFEMEIQYDSGEKIEIDHDMSGAGNQGAVREFDLDIEFVSGDDLEYDFERDGREAEIERRDGSEVEGSAAFEEIEALLSDISITMDRSIQEMKEEVFASIGILEADVEEIDLEIKYE
ncbi:MAG TPA: YusW family protein, partial [Planococcus sp. (in: firmicutes)]|nr:YusW family protein [Planococcus sp. (in: firmicutes)]